MGKVIKKKLNGMSWWMKTSLVLLLTLATTMFMYQGWYKPQQVSAAITTIVTPTSAIGTTAYPTINITIPTSTINQRMLIVGVQATVTAAGTNAVTASYGGTQLTKVTSADTSATSSQIHTYIFYMLENATLMNGTSRPLVVTNGTGATTNNAVWYAVYDGVQQIEPVGGKYNNGTTNAPTGAISVTPTLNIASGDIGFSIFGEALLGATRPTAPSSYPAGWTAGPTASSVTAGTSDYSTRRYNYTSITANATDGVSYTNVDATRISSSAVVIKAQPAATGGTLAVTASAQNVAENVAGGNATITVSRTGGSTGAVSVNYATADGTATAGSDYTSTSGTLNWADGDSADKTITVPIINDALDEVDKTFTVTLSGATGTGVTLGSATQTVTITDDDAQPTIGFASATSSGSNSTTPATFTVQLSAASGNATSVNYATSNGTATAGTDYTAQSGTLNIPALSTTGTINVPISASSTGGTFIITLTSPTNSTLGTSTHTYTITALPPTTITTCGGCHGHPAGPQLLTDGSNRNSPLGKFQGNHSTHAPLTTDCVKCHANPTTLDHADGTISLNATISGGTYQKGTSVTVSNASSFDTTNATCNNTTCHGATSPTWSTSTTQSTCTKCHGVNNTTPAAYTSDTLTAAPGYNTTGRSTGGATAATDAKVGAHDTHLRALNTISSAIACTECHANINTTSPSFTGHMDGAGTLSFGTIATSGTGTAPGYNNSNGTCSNTYCHYGRSPYTPATAQGAVVWTNTNYLTGVDTAAADCGKCHASPPETTVNHTNTLTIADCNGCHNHVNISGVFTNPALHINGVVESQVTCVSCHSKVQGTRSIITGASGEFNLAWGHKKSTRTTVTDSDCIVCHLEGNWTTQKRDQYNASTNPTGRHGDGYIDLRDPDGAGETIIKDNQATPADFRFTKYAVSYAAGSRTTTLGNTVAEVVTTKFCLKCHDGNGATNPTALTRNAANTATTGTQYSPWENVTMGTAAAYSTLNGAASAGYLIDVATQVAATNSSRHPVGAPSSRAYPKSARLAVPYNLPTGRDGNTVAAYVSGDTRVKANSAVMVCDDCHTVTTAIGAVPTLVNRTITAHGTAQTENVRGTFMVASPTLCLGCHGGADANTTTAYTDTTNGDHNSGSAFTVGTTRVMGAIIQNCTNCHFSAYVKPARPIRAQDVHGFNGMQTTGAGWASGQSAGMRPVAFMRQVGNWAASSPRPNLTTLNGTTGQIAIAAGQSTCAGTGDLAGNGTTTSSASCTGNAGKHTNYSPGGTY